MQIHNLKNMPYGINYKRIANAIGNLFVVKPVRAVL